MQQWVTVDRATVGDNEFVLARRADEWVVRVDQRVLMSSRMHQSEIALAERAIERVKLPGSVLVGGLGLGYTLRAVLNLVPKTTRVTVVELVSELVDWNRKYLHELNARALEDPRCEVVVGDAFDLLARSSGSFDIIVLDVDNGPEALSQAKNQRIYGDSGVRACRHALTPGGVLGVWSAGPSDKFRTRLLRSGFDVDVQRVPARAGARGTHVLFLGQNHPRRSDGPTRPKRRQRRDS